MIRQVSIYKHIQIQRSRVQLFWLHIHSEIFQVQQSIFICGIGTPLNMSSVFVNNWGWCHFLLHVLWFRKTWRKNMYLHLLIIYIMCEKLSENVLLGARKWKNQQCNQSKSCCSDLSTDIYHCVSSPCLQITRLCPANQLDKPTLRRIFEAVGLNLPARLLVTAVRRNDNSSLPPHELLSLGTALLAALSTDPDMASHPQLLTTIPLLLGILANGPVSQQSPDSKGQSTGGLNTESSPANLAKSAGEGKKSEESEQKCDSSSEANQDSSSPQSSNSSKLDEAMAADCYQILTAVCALPRGPDQLLSRGAVPALCQAVEQNQTFSHEKGLALLGCLLSGKTKDKVWSKHPAELLSLLVRLSKDFCQAKDQPKLDMCAQLVQFLPPAGASLESEELKGVVARVWGVLRPMLQAKLTPRQIGPILRLSACLLDLFGWELVGPPKFCCLLVNRACVEVRMGLEEPPGNELSPELQHTLTGNVPIWDSVTCKAGSTITGSVYCLIPCENLKPVVVFFFITGCYRIMEAAIEQACCQGVSQTTAPPPQTSTSSLSLQQSRQVLGVLEEAFSALMYHLQQVSGKTLKPLLIPESYLLPLLDI